MNPQTNSKSRQLINELKKVLLNEYGKLIHSVILFGSRAKGKASKESDYDIIVILNHDYDWKLEKQLSKSFYQFELDKGIFTAPHFISVNQLNNTLKGKDPLYENAIKNGIYAQ